MKDLIDRKAVLKIINDELEYSDNVYATSKCITIRRAVNDLPSAQPEPHWIPCSERLPELDDEVLVTDDRGELRHCIFCTWGETWCGFVTYEEGMRIIATAWMPLPEPYQPEEE